MTNESWFDILKEAIVRYGNTGLLVVIFLVAFVSGAFLMRLYLAKIKYAKLEFEVARLREDKSVALSKFEDAGKTIEKLELENKRLIEEHADINDYRYAVKAAEKDAEDVALQDFTISH